MYQNSNLTPRLSRLSHFSIFGLVFFVLKSLLGIKSQWNIDKITFFVPNTRRHRKWEIKTAAIIYSVDLRSFKRLEQRKTLVSIN